MSAGTWRWLRRALQVAGLAAAAWYLVHTAQAHRAELAAVPVQLALFPLLVASVITVLTWFLLVRSWAGSLHWWNQSLPMPQAVRIWFLTNLSRFVPGGIWQFAHLSAEAVGAKVSPVAAAGAVLFQQLVLLGTGVALTAALAPALPGLLPAGLSPAAALAVASLGVAAVIILLPVATPALERLTSRLLRRDIAWPTTGRGDLTRYVATLVLPWVAYGVAFWLFGRGLLGPAAPGVVMATAAFVGSYVAGILAVFAPGGIGVREAALVVLLAPAVGPAAALLLAVASRLWLVALEIATALAVLAWQRRANPNPE